MANNFSQSACAMPKASRSQSMSAASPPESFPLLIKRSIEGKIRCTHSVSSIYLLSVSRSDLFPPTRSRRIISCGGAYSSLSVSSRARAKKARQVNTLVTTIDLRTFWLRSRRAKLTSATDLHSCRADFISAAEAGRLVTVYSKVLFFSAAYSRRPVRVSEKDASVLFEVATDHCACSACYAQNLKVPGTGLGELSPVRSLCSADLTLL